MTITTTIVRTDKGKWLTIGMPEASWEDQKKVVNQMRQNCGCLEDGTHCTNVVIMASTGQVQQYSWPTEKEKAAQDKQDEEDRQAVAATDTPQPTSDGE